MTAETGKPKRAPRRNFEKIVTGLQLYCEAQVKAMTFVKDNLKDLPTHGIDAAIRAYEDVLARIGSGK